MSEKNLAFLTLATAAVGTIVICVLAYKLNAAQDKVGAVTTDPVGFFRRTFGV